MMIKRKPETAREAAAFILFQIREKDAYSDSSLNHIFQTTALEIRDRNFASRLVYGTLQTRYLCDFYIRSFSKIRLKKIDPRILDIMEMAVYQLVFMSHIPDNAAVNESIELIKKYTKANEKTIGYANGVLRSIARDLDHLPALNCQTKAEYYSIQYSHPQWLVNQWIDQFGLLKTKKILKTNNEISPLCIRINTLKANIDTVQNQMEKDGYSVHRHSKIKDLLLCDQGLNIAEYPLFRKGMITVQDGASMTAAEILNVRKDSTVIDCCAAPGGKSFYLAEKMKNTGKIFSCDISPSKLQKIRQGAERLGLTNLEICLQDASVNIPEFMNFADYVLCDVPCSGLGIIRKKPEIRYKEEIGLKELPKIQLAILKNVSRYVKPGGSLVYSTCTILQRENLDVIRAFLSENSNFFLKSFETKITGLCPEGYFTFLPGQLETDGFFVVKLTKM